MPSSTCWPAGDSFHCTIAGPSAAKPGLGRGKYTPLRVIQPARCVVTDTSAEKVTTRSPMGTRPRRPRTRPNASWVDDCGGYASSSVSGSSGAGSTAGGA